MKLVVNLVAAANLGMLAEGLALGGTVGIPAENAVEVLMTSAVASKMDEIKGSKSPLTKITACSHDPKFKFLHMVKDLYYALALGCEAQTPLPITGLVSQVYVSRLREHGEKDISTVSEAGRCW